MTNKQTIDGVSRERLAYWVECLESAGFKDIPSEMRTLLDRPELMCKGAMSLGTGCGECSRCMDELRLAAQHQAGQDRAVSLAMTREMRIYIAGPMTGLPEFNFPAFNAMAEKMRGAGWRVENPAEHGHVDGAEWADYLRYDIARLATCEAIMLLPGWSKSRGAKLEVSIAKELGMPLMFAQGAEHESAAQPQGEVERLKSELAEQLEIFGMQEEKIDTLRAQLAERDALLREAFTLARFTLPDAWHARYAALSTSAELKPRGEPVAKAKPVAKLHAERLTGRDGEYGITVEDSQWFNTCRLTGGVFNLYAEQPAPLATEAAKAFAKGFNTLESGGGKHRINMQFQSREDAWGAFNVLARLKQLNTPQ